jgi:hypothetical protein
VQLKRTRSPALRSWERLISAALASSTGLDVSGSLRSQAVPTPLLSAPAWPGSATFGQVSVASGTPSPSRSGVASSSVMETVAVAGPGRVAVVPLSAVRFESVTVNVFAASTAVSSRNGMVIVLVSRRRRTQRPGSGVVLAAGGRAAVRRRVVDARAEVRREALDGDRRRSGAFVHHHVGARPHDVVGDREAAIGVAPSPTLPTAVACPVPRLTV